ncbi:MAG: ankyrin repeat domain-containing protein, partial [Sphingomonas sp.]
VFKQSALAFAECPEALAHWLVEQGADIQAGDSDGDTPLHARARHWKGRVETLLDLGADIQAGEGARGTPLHMAAGAYNARNVRTLIERGARVDALNAGRQTPLDYALRRCSNAQIEDMAVIAELLLAAGAARPAEAVESVACIGTNFEFHRANYDPDTVDAASEALDRLYTLFDVPPVPRRAMHDGKSPIVATAARWQDRHEQLWELLVPSSGAAGTVQGEVIRISGRIGRELDGNGGINWDAQFRAMADAWLVHVGSGTPLPGPALAEAREIVGHVKRRSGDTRRMAELSVEWVDGNPTPMALPKPAYNR